MNRVALVGRITKEVELKKTQTGKDVANITVAVDKIGGEADFINVVVWNKTAEFLSKYAKKGSRVSVDGRIQTRTYDDQNGKKVYVFEVVADYVDLLENKEKEKDVEFDIGTHNVTKKDDLPF